MAIKINISRILFIALWCAIGAGLLVLLGAAINYRNNKTCKGYKIDISGPSGLTEHSEGDDRAFNSVKSEVQFIDTKEIENLLEESGASKGQGRSIQSFDLRRMESALEKNVWIRDAQLFFDNNEILRVNVLEREPVARVFTEDGNSCYIDSSGAQLPLSPRVVARLPVFTGYPGTKIRRHGADSALTVQICKISSYIRNDPFWMAQIAQLDITPEKTFQLVPMIGDHLILFGDGNNCVEKFHRLFVFYKEVLIRTGFDKYSRIDVEYAGQVIGTKKGSEGTRYDSLQGIKNIQQLIRAARQLQPDTVREKNIKPLEENTMTEQTLTNYDLVPDKGDSAGVSVGTGANAKRSGNKPSGADKPKAGAGKPNTGSAKPVPGHSKPNSPAAGEGPKAVMPARQNRNN